MTASPSYLDSLAPDPLKCSVSGCTYSTPVGCPNWDQMVQLLQIHKDSVHPAPAAAEVRVVHDGKLDSLISATASSNETILCCSDHTAPPEFGDFNFEKLEQEIFWKDAKQVKQNLLELAEEINKTIKADWGNDNRKNVNRARNVCYPLLGISGLLFLIFGFSALFTVDRKGRNDGPLAVLLIGFISCFGIIAVGGCCFCCFCNDTDEEDKKLGEEIKPAVKRWNEANRQLGVMAEFKIEKDGEMIPPELNILKIEGFEREPLL